MSKRRGENRQLRPDEVAAMDAGESEEAGVFAKADAAKMARRRIIKARAPGTVKRAAPEAPPLQTEVPPPVASADPPKDTTDTAASSSEAAPSNPFASFSGLTAPKPLSSSTEAPPANPFASFSGLTNPSTATSLSPSKEATAPANPFASFSGLTNPSSSPTKLSSSTPDALEPEGDESTSQKDATTEESETKKDESPDEASPAKSPLKPSLSLDKPPALGRQLSSASDVNEEDTTPGTPSLAANANNGDGEADE